MEIGYQDAVAERESLARFLDPTSKASSGNDGSAFVNDLVKLRKRGANVVQLVL